MQPTSCTASCVVQLYSVQYSTVQYRTVQYSGVSESVTVRSHRLESLYQYIRVPRNTSLYVFQWRRFTLIRVLYVLYRLPANFTHTSSFCAGRVFIQPVCIVQRVSLVFVVPLMCLLYLMSPVVEWCTDRPYWCWEELGCYQLQLLWLWGDECCWILRHTFRVAW